MMFKLTPPAVLSLNGTPQLVLNGDAVDVSTPQTGAVAGASTRRVMQLLGARLRIKISDGRVLVGTFHCFDKHQNVILTDTREYVPVNRVGSTSANGKKGGNAKEQTKSKQQQEDDEREEEDKELWKTGTSRSLGMALVPGKHIVYIKVETRALPADA